MINARSKVDAKSGLKLVSVAQLVVAGLLIESDVVDAIPLPSNENEVLRTGPISPGDQKRIYRTDKPAPDLVTIDGPLELPMPQKFSDRLEFTEHSIEGFGNVVLVSGGISKGDTGRLRDFFENLEEVPDLVALHSPGGLVYEALGVGRYLREKELPSAVLAGAVCVSSCPYILAGGLERTVSLRGVVGMHQHYYEQPKYLPVFFAVENIQTGQGETMEYLINMGVDPALMLYSLKTPPDQIYALVEDELTDTRIATKIIE